MTRRLLSLAALSIGLAAAITGCASRASAPPARDAAVDLVASFLTGTFDSADQAASDPSYFDVRLVTVPLWTERTDGRWLYVEQAISSAADRPYRQRVYRVWRDQDSVLRSDVYTLPEPGALAGAWRTPERLGALTPEMLTLRDGCSIVLEAVRFGEFVGQTLGSGCSSSLSGASYATSEVRLRPDRVESWDRGFDDSGEQVWGATDGAYVFIRRADGPPA